MQYSGIEWIGSIPDEWKLINLGVALKEYWESNEEIDSHALQFKYGTIIPKKEIELTPENLEMLSKYNKVKKDVIMVNGLNLAFDFITQRVAIVEEDGVITSTYIALKPTNFVIPRFMLYLLKAYDNQKVFHALGRGLRCMLSYETLKREKVLFCDKQKQQMIADRIDFVCEKIEKAIALETQQIEKLKEYKQAIITEAVTKGLDKNAPMKDSGVEWIGNIPIKAQITRIGHLFEIILGKMVSPVQTDKDQTLEKYYCAANVHFEDLQRSDLKKMWFNQIEKLAFSVKKGDLLVVEGGAGAGGANLVDYDISDTYIQNSIMILRKKSFVEEKWLYYVLYSYVKRGYIDFVCHKATIPHFTKDKIGNTQIPFFDKDMMRKILILLDKKIAEIDHLIEIKEQKIEKLNEYKKSLIYEYVTGKKEVI